MWLWSYVTANFALILVVVLAVVALGALAWFAKNWKLALAALVVLALAFAYQQIDRNAYQRRVSEEAATKVAIIQKRLEALNSLAEAYTARYEADQAELTKLKRIASETPINRSPCLDLNAARRVRDIR